MKNTRPRIVLTGASGLVGGAILNGLQQYHYPTLVLTRRNLNTDSSIQQCICDLQYLDDSLNTTLNTFAPDVMIHAGWMGSDNQQRNQPDILHANFEASIQLLKVAQMAGCKRFIGFGSQAEYSPNLQTIIDENSPTHADTAYGIAKRELYLQQKAFCDTHGMDFLWLRLFTCFGKNMHSSYVIPYLIDCFTRNITPQLNAPNAIGDYLHVADAAAGIIAALEKHQQNGVYNLASGKEISVGELALQLTEFFPDFDIKTLREQIKNNQQPACNRIADVSAFMRDFNWQPTISLAEGLQNCL